MTAIALLDCFVYVAGHDFTTDENEARLTAEAEALPKTTFGSGGWHEHAYGLKTVKFAERGWWQSAASDAVDPDSFANLGVIDRVHSFGPIETEAQPAYMFLAGKAKYEMFGTVGALAPFSLESQGTNGVGAVRGQLGKARGSVSATGALGSGLNLGAVGASQYLYATFHVFSAGTTITVQVESDDAGGFASPTARGTIGPLTARGGTWMTRVAGPITDTHYRFNVTAITGTFTVAGAIGIGS